MRPARILFVSFPYSVHAGRWISLLRGTDWDVHVFPSQRNNHLHESFDHLTYWPVPEVPLVLNGQEDVRLGSLPGGSQMAAGEEGLAEYLSAVIDEVGFDIVHSLEFQHAGYLTSRALKNLSRQRPLWIATNYGADIILFAKDEAHEHRVREVLAGCDLYSAECERDVRLARSLGFPGKVFTILPNSGGIDLAAAQRLRRAGPSSQRGIIAVKGYQHFAGRALTALQAIDLCRPFLQGYEVRVFAPFPEVRAEAERLAVERGIKITCLPDQVQHEEILRLHGSARASIAISIADGISTSLLEAMAMGSFPIQTSTACADEWIEDGTSGFIVHPDNPYQIAHCLSLALTDDALVDRAAERNWEVIGRKADRAKIEDQVRSAYSQVREQHVSAS